MTDVSVFGLRMDWDESGARKADASLSSIEKKLDKTADSADRANAKLKGVGSGAQTAATASEQAASKFERLASTAQNVARGLQTGDTAAVNMTGALTKLGGVGFASVITGAVGAVGALLAFNLQLGRTATEQAAAARGLGVTVESYQRLSIASGLVGVSTSSVDELLRSFQKTLGANGRTLEDYLAQLGTIPDANQRVAVATAGLGDVSAESARLIIALTDASGQLGKEIDATGAVMNSVTVNQLAAMDRRFALLELQVGTFTKKTLLGLSDGLAEVGLALSGDEAALQRFRAEQDAAARATSGTTGAVDQQRAAIDALAVSLRNLDFKGIAAGTRARVASIAELVSSGSNRALTKSEAAAVLKQQRGADPTFNAALQRDAIFQQNQKLFNDLISPNTGTAAGGGRSALAKSKTEAEQLREQLLGVRKEIAWLSNSQSVEFGLTRQLISARAEADRLMKSLRGVIDFPQVAELRGGLVPLPYTPDLKNIPTPASVLAAQRAAADVPTAPGLLLSEQVSLRNVQLERDRARIQADIATGVTSELQAKRQMLGLERDYSSEITAIYEAQKKIVGLSAEEIANLDAQIQRARALGVELSTRQQISAGLRDGLKDAGTINRDFGKGLQNSVRAGIYTGITEGGKEGLRTLLDNLSGVFATAATERLTTFIFGDNGLFKTPKFNPADDAKTASGSAASKAAAALGVGGGDAVGVHVSSLDMKSTVIIDLLRMIERNTATGTALAQAAEERAIAAASARPGWGQIALNILGTFTGALVGGLAGGAFGSRGGGTLTGLSFGDGAGVPTFIGGEDGIPFPFGGGRANGGPVDVGNYYEWQENQREFFVPKVPGRVVREDQMPAGKNVTINLTMNIQTQDADSFRKSKNQVLLELRRALIGVERLA